MKRVLFAVSMLVLFCGTRSRAQQIPSPSTNVSTQQLTLLPQVPVAVVNTVQESPSIQGNATYYYWFVSHQGGVTSPPAGPFPVFNAPSTLGGINTITVTWNPAPSVTTYDVLRTTTTAAPTGACACAVVTGTAGTSLIDNAPATSAYTVSTTANQIPCIITNIASCSAISPAAGVEVISVASSPYNVKGDAQIVNGTPQAPGSGSCPAGATFGCVTLSSPGFVAGDVGKIIFSYQTSDGEVAQPTGTILKVDSSTVAEVSLAFTRNGNGSVVWGTDFNAQIQNASAAANSSGETLYFPCGNYILTSELFSTSSLQGASQACTIFYPASSATGWPGGSIIANQASDIQSGNFTLNGAGGIVRNVTGSAALLFWQVDRSLVANVRINSFSSDSGAQFMILDSHDSTFVNTPRVDQPAPQDISPNCELNGDSNLTIIGHLCSNGKSANFLITGSNSISFNGGLTDECGSSTTACTQLTSSEASFSGTTLYGGNGAGNFSISVDGTSHATIVNAILTPFNGTNGGGGIQIATGGTVDLSQSAVTAQQAGSIALSNSGTLHDDGGNTWTATGGATLFSGNAPVFSTFQSGAVTAGHVATFTGTLGGLQDGGTPNTAIQSSAVVNLSADVALTSGTPATILTASVTMPSSGCPCRVLVSYEAYATTNNQTFNTWVGDGTNFMASAQTTGTGTNTTGISASQISPVTYANSAVVTFTLSAEDNGVGGTIKAAPLQGSGTNSWMSISVVTSQ